MDQISPAPAPLVVSTRDHATFRIALNRPDSRNALNSALMIALLAALDEAEADPLTHVVVIIGEGPAFCSGHDLRELRAAPDRAAREAIFSLCSTLMTRVVRLSKPVIAQVHGIATAAGCQLVASCDLAVASADAKFATPGVNIGLFCTTPSVALSRAVGRKAAMEMLLTGAMTSAARAVEIGLVNRAVPPDALEAEVSRLAAEIGARSPSVVALGKAAFQRQAEMSLDDAYAYASGVMVENLESADAAEGIEAFLGKRAPVWRRTGQTER